MAKRRRAIRKTVLAVVGLVLFAGLAFGILIRYQPAFYVRAQELTKDDIETQSKLFKRQCSDTVNAFTERRPEFRLFLTEKQINAWMQSPSGAPYMMRLPGEIVGPCVRFRKGRIILAAWVEEGLLSAVVQVELRATPDGDAIRLALKRIRRGALPMLDATIRRLILRAAKRFPDWVTYEAKTDTFVIRPMKKNVSFEKIKASKGQLIIEGRTGYEKKPDQED